MYISCWDGKTRPRSTWLAGSVMRAPSARWTDRATRKPNLSQIMYQGCQLHCPASQPLLESWIPVCCHVWGSLRIRARFHVVQCPVHSWAVDRPTTLPKTQSQQLASPPLPGRRKCGRQEGITGRWFNKKDMGEIKTLEYRNILPITKKETKAKRTMPPFSSSSVPSSKPRSWTSGHRNGRRRHSS